VRGGLGLCGSALLVGCILGSGCRGVAEDVVLVFPDEGSMAATRILAMSAFVPLATDPETEKLRFVSCGEVGTFVPTRTLDPAKLGDLPNFGEVLEKREVRNFPFSGDWTLGLRRVEPDPIRNPWGAVMVFVEARGEARASPEEGGGALSATLLSGCYCVRTAEGSHPDSRLDQQVKRACAPPSSASPGGPRTLPLEPVVPGAFRLISCGPDSLTAPRGSVLSPGPAVCLDTVRCDDAPGVEGCFPCEQPCSELRDLSNAPIVFEVDQPGGRTSPTSQIVLTGPDGSARADLTVDECAAPITVRASLVGSAAAPLTFQVGCVDPVPGFECGGEVAFRGDEEPVSIVTLPGEGADPDRVAVLFFDGRNSSVQVHDPLGATAPVRLSFPEETARALHGFHYEVGERPEDASVPALALVTSVRAELRVRIFRWQGGELVPHDGRDGWLDPVCTSWNCGSLVSCGEDQSCPGLEQCQDDGRCVTPKPDGDATCSLPEPVRCGCRARVEFQSEVSLASADLDGDGRVELALAVDTDLPVSVFRSALAPPGAFYAPNGCECATVGQTPSTFELLNLGGPGEGAFPARPDLVMGSPGGAFVRYGTVRGAGSMLTCGGSVRFGDLVPVRDVVRGRFACDPFRDASSCAPYEDVVVVSAKSLGGGTFDDPGIVRVVFGGPGDVAALGAGALRPGASVELGPLAFAGRSQPRDPRAAEVADFNGDGFDDLAVLYAAGSEEVHVWLGGGRRGLGEVAEGVVLERCPSSLEPASTCTPLKRFATPDLDGDGRAEVVVVCDPSNASARLRWFAARR
jgi:hypothetical protein